ncbi:transmembrane protein 81 [Melanerpes formicivorus]|uniref:transmembrane protein 81 n=1 Tax=Melanerpes formicivorus TaxID=211600 RepID=UPI0035901159
MKPAGSSHAGGLLLAAFSLPLGLSLGSVTIPAELKTAVIRVAVNATSCSVTCGVGSRLEELCELSGAGQRRNCTLQRSSCRSSSLCGLLHFTASVGKPFQLICLDSEAVGLGSGAYRYRWRFAPGLITTNKLLLKPLRSARPVLRSAAAREADAGTYQCDVQSLKDLQVVKRIYFGLRMIQEDLADLDFYKSLTWEQKLAAKRPEGTARNSTKKEVQRQKPSWQGKVWAVYWVGLGSGVLGGVLVSLVASCLFRKLWRRRAAKQ